MTGISHRKSSLKGLRPFIKMSLVMERTMKEKLINYIEHADHKSWRKCTLFVLGLEKDERKTQIQEERTKYLNGKDRSLVLKK